MFKMKDGKVRPATLRLSDKDEAELLDAMRLFDSYDLIALQRAISPDGTKSGYRCSIPLYTNDPNKAGQLIATIDGDGDTAAEAIRKAVAKISARSN